MKKSVRVVFVQENQARDRIPHRWQRSLQLIVETGSQGGNAARQDEKIFPNPLTSAVPGYTIQASPLKVMFERTPRR